MRRRLLAAAASTALAAVLVADVGATSAFSIATEPNAGAAARRVAAAFKAGTACCGCCCALLGAAVLSAPPPAAADDAVVVRVASSGEALFRSNCSGCHRGGGNVIAREKTLQKEALEAYLDGGRTEEAVANLVANGKSAMPAFRNRFSDDDLANVAAYVIASSEEGWAQQAK